MSTLSTLSNGPVVPGAPGRLALRPLAGGMRLDGGFWGGYQALNAEVTIPHGMAMLEETGSLQNLRVAAGLAADEYAMPLFRDSDVYKVLEAIAWQRQHGGDQARERFFDEAVGLLRAAQRPDGYLNSYVQVAEGGKRFANPAMGHELYCAGHLMQAAVADLRSGGDPRGLAGVAGRFATLLTELLPGPLAGFVPGHPEIEMALVEFARATGRSGLVGTAADLVARRGRSTLHWPPRERPAGRTHYQDSFDPAYFCDDVPFERADAIRGHAVRAFYLLSGATDVYLENGNAALLRAALAQWDDLVAGKMYLTGGTGSRHKREAFGDAYELPSDRAYCETCAAIGSVMWNWRMLLATGEARFGALIERTLYNGFLAGLGLDGANFFYVNPLQTRSPARRQPWYQCACCPPNVMRLLASLGHYMATGTDTGVQIHQFAAGHLRAALPGAGALELELATGYPYSGELAVRVAAAPSGAAEVAIRVPDWAPDATAALNGRDLGVVPGDDGYLHVRREWAAGDDLVVSFPLAARTIRPSARIDAVRGCVAFERGPLVYCFEGVDLPGAGARADGLTGARVLSGARAAEVPGMSVSGHTVTALAVPGALGPAREPGWPYLDAVAPARIQVTGVELTAIPYYAWANREPGDMRVWIPER
ncbi:MAG TPA: beta-L-arabinofuranosidase domain-containing protein [Streptosporangiaceae bacterium]